MRRSSPERRRLVVLGAAGVIVGVAAEAIAFQAGDVDQWLPDLTAGWCLIGCGLLTLVRRPGSRSGALMAASGLAWFAGTVLAPALYLYRGPLVHLLLAYPDEPLRGRRQRLAVGGGYVAAAVAPVWRSDVATLAISAAIVVLAIVRTRECAGRRRRAARYAERAAVLFAALLAATAVVRLAVPTPEAAEATLIAYDLALGALAVALLVGLVRAPWERPVVTDLVVDLGDVRAAGLRGALARTLGDPRLEVAYPLADGSGHVDAAGRRVSLPEPGSARQVTPVERDGEVVAAVVHDAGVLEDLSLPSAVAAAAGLAAANARLQAEVRGQLEELQASRRRLLLAGDEERRLLEQRLYDGAQRRLNVALPLIAEARQRAGSPETVRGLERSQVLLEHTLAELGELAGGLHPRDLADGDLAAAVGRLAARAPVPVELAVTAGPLSLELRTAAYYVCSEALANVAKYAAATRVTVTVAAVDGELRVEVADDGVGGADPGRGSGLRGLRDRVEALGGSLELVSPANAGTRVSARLPLG